MRKVSIGQYFRTIHDVDDGLGGMTRSCREYTLLRDHQDSDFVGWISGHTRIGPVCQVKIRCCLDPNGIEIQVPSTSRDGSNSWNVLSRGPNRYVNESWHDRDDSAENGEVVSSTSVERSHAITSGIKESHASKPQAQSCLMNHSKEFIQIYKRKWNDILAYGIVEGKISKRLTALVRYREHYHREIHRAVHWSLVFLKLRLDIESEGARVFSDSQWLGYINSGSNKPRFRCYANSTNNLW